MSFFSSVYVTGIHVLKLMCDKGWIDNSFTIIMSHRNNKKSKKRSKHFKHNRKIQKRSRKPVKRHKKPLHKVVSKRKRKVLPQQGGFFIPFMPPIHKMVYTPGVSEKRTAYML